MSAAPHVPAALHFPDHDGRPEGWGRLLRLAANSAEIATLSKLVKGDTLRLSFEVQGESFELARADIQRVWRDADGYFVGEARFLDEEMKARLAKALLDLLSTKADG
ncbi:MAG: hypothetical protein HY922_14845 [Elusimicrobia bacterium]|nr:hypothetical protein [Elusimicrobiota bacterium]